MSEGAFDPKVGGLPEKMIPMFVGVGADPLIMVIFRSAINLRAYSTFPAVCGTKMAPNCFFTLSQLDTATNLSLNKPHTMPERDACLFDILEWKLGELGYEALTVKPYTDLQCTGNSEDEKTAVIFALTETSCPEAIIRDILLPHGIGAFYASESDIRMFMAASVFPHRCVGMYETYVPIAFSEEAVSQMLLADEIDMDAFNAAAMICLRWPLRQRIFCAVDLGRIRDRFVFFNMMMRNQPVCDTKGQRKTVKVGGDTRHRYEVGKAEPYQWVYMYWGGCGDEAEAVIGNPDSRQLDMFESGPPREFCIKCPFGDHRVQLMSPSGGPIYVLGNGDGYVDVYLRKTKRFL